MLMEEKERLEKIKKRDDGRLNPATSGQTRPRGNGGGWWEKKSPGKRTNADKTGHGGRAIAAFARMRVGNRVRILANAATGHGGWAGSSAFWRMQLRDTGNRRTRCGM